MEIFAGRLAHARTSFMLQHLVIHIDIHGPQTGIVVDIPPMNDAEASGLLLILTVLKS